MKVRIIDLETTGLNADPDARVIEAGFTDLLPGGVISETRSRLFDPGVPIPPEMSAIHHLVDSDVAGKPSHETARNWLMEGMQHGDMLAAHHAEFERHFIVTVAHQWICTFKVSYNIYPEFKSHSNQALRYRLGLPVDPIFANNAHRAGPDSLVTAHLLKRMLDDGQSISQLLDLTNLPMLLRTCPLKKYRGQPWEDVDDGYLEWIIDVSDTSEDVKATAAHHLKLRRTQRADVFGGS